MSLKIKRIAHAFARPLIAVGIVAGLAWLEVAEFTDPAMVALIPVITAVLRALQAYVPVVPSPEPEEGYPPDPALGG